MSSRDVRRPVCARTSPAEPAPLAQKNGHSLASRFRNGSHARDRVRRFARAPAGRVPERATKFRRSERGFPAGQARAQKCCSSWVRATGEAIA
jgi:hypothetical protein